jgi:DNA-binding cell septation regulator SpoVG
MSVAGIVISEVVVRLNDPNDKKILAYVSLTLNGAYCVSDLKIVNGNKGVFVAMPSRRSTEPCEKCGAEISLEAYYCCRCGHDLGAMKEGIRRHVSRRDGIPKSEVRLTTYADIFYPIYPAARHVIHEAVMAEWGREIERSKQPGYVPTWSRVRGRVN